MAILAIPSLIPGIPNGKTINESTYDKINDKAIKMAIIAICFTLFFINLPHLLPNCLQLF